MFTEVKYTDQKKSRNHDVAVSNLIQTLFVHAHDQKKILTESIRIRHSYALYQDILTKFTQMLCCWLLRTKNTQVDHD